MARVGGRGVCRKEGEGNRSDSSSPTYAAYRTYIIYIVYNIYILYTMLRFIIYRI